MEGPPLQETQVKVGEQEAKPAFLSRVFRSGQRNANRLIGATVLASAALGPGQADAMDNNTRNAVYGISAAVLNQQTGVVVRPDFNGRPVLDVNATMQNRQIMEQRQRAYQEQMMRQQQAAAIEQHKRNLDAQFQNLPTQLNMSPQIKQEFEANGIVVIQAGEAVYMYHKDNIAQRITFTGAQNAGIKMTGITVNMLPGGSGQNGFTPNGEKMYFVEKAYAQKVVQNGMPNVANLKENLFLTFNKEKKTLTISK